MFFVNDKKKCDTEIHFCRIFAFFLNALMITDFFRIINKLWLKLPLIYTEYFRNTMYVIIFIIFISIFFKGFRARAHELIIMICLYIFAALASVLTTPEISTGLIEVTLLFLSRCIPAFFFARYIQDYKYLFKILKKYTLLNMAYSLVPYFFSIQDTGILHTSYNLIIPCITAVYCIAIEKKFIYLIPFTLFLTTIILFGLRGPFACIMAVILIYLVIQIKKVSAKYKFIVVYLVIVFCIVLPVVYDGTVSRLYSVNPNSRTITLLDRDSFFDLTGRDEFYRSAVQIITDSPLAFRGILSDRYLIGKVDMGKDNWLSCYAHNLVLELCVQFGLVAAVLIIIFLIAMLFKTLKDIVRSEDNYKTLFVSTAVVYVFVQLMFSGSYVTEYSFYIGLGVLMKKQGGIVEKT
jgi:O-antigen ligase